MILRTTHETMILPYENMGLYCIQYFLGRSRVCKWKTLN